MPQVLTITPLGCRKLETSCCSASAARGATCGFWPERLGVLVSGGGSVPMMFSGLFGSGRIGPMSQ